MYIQRHEQKHIEQALSDGFVAVVYGARQVGKTTIAKEITKGASNPLYLNCE